MFVFMKKIPRFWLAGTLTALAGVAVARLLAPELEVLHHNAVLVVKTLGHFVAFFGIFLIARGISKSRAEAEE